MKEKKFDMWVNKVTKENSPHAFISAGSVTWGSCTWLRKVSWRFCAGGWETRRWDRNTDLWQVNTPEAPHADVNTHVRGFRWRSALFGSVEVEENACLKEAKELGKVMDLNIVRLQFTAYLQDSNGGFTRALKPVVSNPIYDSSESKRPDVCHMKHLDHVHLLRTWIILNLHRACYSINLSEL